MLVLHIKTNTIQISHFVNAVVLTGNLIVTDLRKPGAHHSGSVHTEPEKFDNATITGQINHVIIVTSWFSQSPVFKLFSVHTKTKSWRFKFLPSFLQIPLNSVFKKLRFRDGLIWTVGLTVEISDVTDFFFGVVWMMPKRNTIVYDSHLNITFLLFFDACKCYGYVNIFI